MSIGPRYALTRPSNTWLIIRPPGTLITPPVRTAGSVAPFVSQSANERYQRETNEQHAAAIRGAMIDRLEVNATTGMLGDILTDIEPALDHCGYSRLDLLQAIQESLFPEEFLESKSLKGILPKGGGAGGGEQRLLALARLITAGPGKLSPKLSQQA